MHGNFTTAIPVTGEPLPLAVRQEIHELVRRGCTVLAVEPRRNGWKVIYDGPRSLFSIVPGHTGSAQITNLGKGTAA